MFTFDVLITITQKVEVEFLFIFLWIFNYKKWVKWEFWRFFWAFSQNFFNVGLSGVCVKMAFVGHFFGPHDDVIKMFIGATAVGV